MYRHGVIHSPSDPSAQAVLVADGVVAWLGTDDAASGLADSVDDVIDLDGAKLHRRLSRKLRRRNLSRLEIGVEQFSNPATAPRPPPIVVPLTLRLRFVKSYLAQVNEPASWKGEWRELAKISNIRQTQKLRRKRAA